MRGVVWPVDDRMRAAGCSRLYRSASQGRHQIQSHPTDVTPTRRRVGKTNLGKTILIFAIAAYKPATRGTEAPRLSIRLMVFNALLQALRDLSR